MSDEQIVADIVVGADGVRSIARELVLGYEDMPKSSGYAVLRAWYGAAAQSQLPLWMTDLTFLQVFEL